MSAFWSGHVGAAAGCCLLLSERCVCVLWSGLAGAAAGCRCRVLLSERCVRLETGMLMQLQRAVAGCCFMGAVRLELAYAAGPLQGAAAGAACGCCCHSGVRFGAGMLVPLQLSVRRALSSCALERACWPQGATARCCLRGCVCVCVCLWFPQVGVFDLVLFFKDLIPPGTTRGL